MARRLTQTTENSRFSYAAAAPIASHPKRVTDVRQQFTSFEHNNATDDRALQLILDRLKTSGGKRRANRFLISGVVR